MSIESSVTTDVPAPATAAPPDVDTSATDAEVQPEDDYGTTPGGPTMIWIFTGIFVLATWLRRRYRKRRELR